MTYYFQEITRIKNSCYANQAQLDTVIGTRQYIDRHFDTAISLDKLSHTRLTSKFHLLRLFKKYYGQTPKQFLTGRRMEQAKQLLTNGTPVTDTCFMVGFDSPCSFSTLFKSRTGSAPSEFQRKATFTKSASLAACNFTVQP